MDSIRYQRARSVFLAAIDAPPEERDSIVRDRCADDPELLREVQELLRDDFRAAPDILGRAAPVRDVIHVSRSMVGRQIGRYRVAREIGSGGMGRVYEATQESPRRSVALKIMRSLVATQEVLRRFAFEVELLGQLRHAGIAQIYEAGVLRDEDEEIPWFAMELIPGARPLDAFVREENLTPRARVALLAEICDAVQYGHQRGVVHRDLKPGNILVDTEGHPKVIDFGVAKSTNSDVALTTLQTNVGTIVGTLQYMSPEQCDADAARIDARTDVYSLGVLLYEMLCERTPYDVAGMPLPAAARAVREREPLRPSAVRRSLRGDLEAILLKAMDKDRDRRYASAAELAADCRRHLAGERVEARTPSWRWEVSRWIGRRPVLATILACCVVVGTSAIAVLLTLEYSFRRPDHVTVEEAGRRARLESRAGRSLHEWDSKIDAGVASAQFVEASGREPLILLGWSGIARIDRVGEFTVHSSETPASVLWGSRDVPFVPPPGEPDRTEAKFVLNSLLVEDVFPETRDPEIVALFRLNLYSASTIRVYDLAGHLLYEAWHDGALDALQWMASSRQIVVIGLDSEFRWDERGIPLEPSYPAVIFAVEPRMDRTGSPHWLVRDGRRRDDSLRWYKWLGPAASAVMLHTVVPSFGGAASRSGWGEMFNINFVGFLADRERSQKPCLSFVLDLAGNVVKRYPADSYKSWRDAGVLPDATTFDLLEYEALPPGAHKSQSPARAPGDKK